MDNQTDPAGVAEEQARTAEEMEDSQRRFYEAARRLESVRDDVHARGAEVRALAKRVHAIQPPDV